MINKIILVGRLGQDPEVQPLGQSGDNVTRFSLATSRKFNTRDGEKKETTQWHKIQCFGAQGENCARYLNKGSLVYIEGEVRYRKYEKDGVERYATDIYAQSVQFLDSKSDKENGMDVPF
tara:strand:- start:3217 stop:3576 length:360 start_codon:yes stop_codon:yes gene_type:complete